MGRRRGTKRASSGAQQVSKAAAVPKRARNAGFVSTGQLREAWGGKTGCVGSAISTEHGALLVLSARQSVALMSLDVLSSAGAVAAQSLCPVWETDLSPSHPVAVQWMRRSGSQQVVCVVLTAESEVLALAACTGALVCSCAVNEEPAAEPLGAAQGEMGALPTACPGSAHMALPQSPACVAAAASPMSHVLLCGPSAQEVAVVTLDAANTLAVTQVSTAVFQDGASGAMVTSAACTCGSGQKPALLMRGHSCGTVSASCVGPEAVAGMTSHAHKESPLLSPSAHARLLSGAVLSMACVFSELPVPGSSTQGPALSIWAAVGRSGEVCLFACSACSSGSGAEPSALVPLARWSAGSGDAAAAPGVGKQHTLFTCVLIGPASCVIAESRVDLQAALVVGGASGQAHLLEASVHAGQEDGRRFFYGRLNHVASSPSVDDWVVTAQVLGASPCSVLLGCAEGPHALCVWDAGEVNAPERL